MTDFSVQSTPAAATEDHRWLAGDASAFDTAQSGTIEVSSLTSGTHYDATTKVVPSGLLLSKVGDFFIPFDGANEVQTITISATGGTFTLTFAGEATAAITYPATAATVQAALEALSNVEPGDIIVTGASGGPYTLTFGGQYTGEDVPQLTSAAGSLTGGSGTIVHATTTAGGASDGGTVVDGILLYSVDLLQANGSLSEVIVVAYTKDATIIPAKLPVAAQRAITRFTPTTCKLALVA